MTPYVKKVRIVSECNVYFSKEALSRHSHMLSCDDSYSSAFVTNFTSIIKLLEFFSNTPLSSLMISPHIII